MEPNSLIIASRNRPELLADAVESVLNGTRLPTELIVVDQSDRAHPTLAGKASSGPCELRYIWSRSRGLSRANNLGVEAARYDLLAFAHDDVRVSPQWLEALLNTASRAGPRTIVTGRVLAESASDGFAPSVNASVGRAEYRGRIGQDVLYPHNMAMYRTAVDEVGGFDERLGPGTEHPAAEDNDLGFRLLERGFTILFEPDAVLYHRAWRPSSERRRLRYDYGRGQGGFYAKHFRLRDPYVRRRVARDVATRISRIVAGTGRSTRPALDELAYLRGLVVGMTRWWWRERR